MFPQANLLTWYEKKLSQTQQKHTFTNQRKRTHTRLTALFPGLPRSAGTRKVKPIWILLKQEIVSGSGISWAIYKSALRSRQITTPAPYRPPLSFLQARCPSCRPTNSVKALKAIKGIKGNVLQQKNKDKETKGGLVAFYDIRPGNRACLFSEKTISKGGDK